MQGAPRLVGRVCLHAATSGAALSQIVRPDPVQSPPCAHEEPLNSQHGGAGRDRATCPSDVDAVPLPS